MVSTRLSLRAAILFTVIAVGEVAASGSGNGAVLKKHRKRGRCSPPHTGSSDPAASLTSPDLALPTSTSTFDTIVIPTTTSETETGVETTTSSIEEEATTLSVEETSMTSSTEETTVTTSTEAVITSTAEAPSVPTITEGPTSTSESLIATTSITSCEPTIATWAPELCSRYVPAPCSDLTVTSLPAATMSAKATACSTALQGYDAQAVPEVSSCFSSCFSNLGQAAGFNPTSAYSCVSSASIYCSSTLACAPAATSVPVIPEYNNPGFESGDFGSWYELPGTTPNNLVGTISTEVAHSGSHSLKLQFNNLANDNIGFAHRVKFQPGSTYQFSFWFYHVAQVTGTLSLKIHLMGTAASLSVQTGTQGVNKWIQYKFSMTPPVSFGDISVNYVSTKQANGDTIYIDDITVTKVA